MTEIYKWRFVEISTAYHTILLKYQYSYNRELFNILYISVLAVWYAYWNSGLVA